MALVPLPKVFGSSGTVDLGTIDSNTAPTAYTSATAFVNVTAGSDVAENDCVVPCNAGFIAIEFNSVTFSGSQFRLYLSTNGFSQINFTAGQTQDYQYGPTFDVSGLAGAFAAVAGGPYHIGTVAGDMVVEGPIPTAISNAYKFIKIFDGSSTSVAASLKKVGILPGISVVPTMGPAGTSLIVSGGGFPANKVIDILDSYTTYQWTTDAPIASAIANLSTGISTGNGFFSKTMTAPDTKEVVATLGGLHNNVPVALFAKLEKAPHTLYATTTYNETPRFLTEVVSRDNSGACVDATGSCATPFSSTAFYGNDTGATGPIVLNGVLGALSNVPLLDANVLGTLIIAGNDSYVNAAVTFWIGTTQIGSTTADAAGNFNGTASIPVLPSGPVTVVIKSNGVTYNFQINVLPTLILTPNKGPVGTTVSVAAYGFPANKHVSLWWYRYVSSGSSDFYLVNGTVSTSGSYNVSVTFVVPHAYGGSHFIDATYDVWASPTPRGSITGGPGYVTSGTFTVTPTIIICNDSTNQCGSGDIDAHTISVNSNTRTLLSAVGTGLDPFSCIVAAIDIAQNDFNTCTNGAGDTFMNFTAAGFRPGLHQVEFYQCDTTQCVGAPDAWAFFNVTTTGDYIVSTIGDLHGLTTTLNAINTNVNTILGWSSTITSISTSVTSMSSAVTTIKTNVDTILGWSSTITGISSKVDAISTTLGNIPSGLSTTLANIQSAASAAQTAATGAKTSADSALAAANTAGSSVSSTQTYVLVVAVLAAITVVLELALLVRKLS